MPEDINTGIQYSELVQKYEAYAYRLRDYYDARIAIAFSIAKEVSARIGAPSSYTRTDGRVSWEEPYVGLIGIGEDGASVEVDHQRDAVEFDRDGHFKFAVYVVLEPSSGFPRRMRLPVLVKCAWNTRDFTVEINDEAGAFHSNESDQAVSFAAGCIINELIAFLDAEEDDLIENRKVGFALN